MAQRHYVCPECDTPVGNREVAMKRVPLWDQMEQCFVSPRIQQRVRDRQEESAIKLSNQSKERALVGDVI